jgi:hypothetical protein
MKRVLVLLAALAVSACTSGPNLGVGIGVGGGDVSVHPSISGRLGGIGVSIWG